MGYRLNKIIEKIEEVYPRELALDWDNPGLLIGHRDKEIEKVLIVLDADGMNIAKAVEMGADLILSHHPIIFGSIRKVSDDDALGAKLLSLIEHNIAVYSMHTNFDIGAGGMGDAAAIRLGASDYEPLEITCERDGREIGVGFVYDLPAGGAMSAGELAERVKNVFSLDKVLVYDTGRPISRIAVCPGSGRGMSEHVLRSRADAFITGDMGHHDGLDYKDAGVTLIDAGHFGIEHIFTEVMEDFMRKHYPDLIIYRGDEDERVFI